MTSLGLHRIESVSDRVGEKRIEKTLLGLFFPSAETILFHQLGFRTGIN